MFLNILPNSQNLARKKKAEKEKKLHFRDIKNGEKKEKREKREKNKK